MNRAEAESLDRHEPLAAFPGRFVVPDPGLCYLDGNSLGRLPRTTVDRIEHVVTEEWGRGLVRSWDEWIDLPARVGDAIGALIGAPPGSVIVADSVTVNLFKVAVALLDVSDRREMVVAETEFPTDRYVLARIAEHARADLRLVGDVRDAITERTALVVSSVVDFRTGEWFDIPALAALTHAAGAALVLDLSHAAGAVPVDLTALGVSAAVGCTYKYLCGGPGAPAFLYLRPDLALRSPIAGWFAQRDQFAMGLDVDPLPGAAGFAAGTPIVLGLAAVEEGVRLVADAGIDRIRARSLALTDLVMDRIDAWKAPVEIITPRPPDSRGGHIAVRIDDASALGAAARRRGVVPDVRPPDVLRVGPAPLSTTFVEVWDGLDRLGAILADDGWRTTPVDRVP